MDVASYDQCLVDLALEIWQIAENHGFHRGRTFGDACALLHSEVSEAYESFRKNGRHIAYIEVDGKPEGTLSELADILIRVFDTALFDVGASGQEFASVIRHKVEYNRRRPYMHGKSI